MRSIIRDRVVQRLLPVLALVVSFSLAEARCGQDEIRVPQMGVGLEEYSEDVRARIRAVEERFSRAAVQEDGTPPLSLAQRMSDLRVPGVSIAVIQDGAIEWARGYGMLEIDGDLAVTSETRFQAASISKPVAAMAALRLVERGLIDLDEDVNARLETWKVPDSPFLEEERVTLRRLLSHSAGLTVHGFAGYPPGKPFPDLRQILNGESPANSAAVRVDILPGSRYRYSGGGYIVLEQLLEDVTGKPFAGLLAETVLVPLGMDRSTYEALGPEELLAVAKGHSRRGALLEGSYRVYPEHAAAGLWTTPTDLARFAIDLMNVCEGEEGLLSSEMVRRMLTKVHGSHGLGLSLAGGGDAFAFSHGGSNQGFKCHMLVFPRTGQGIVVMTNGDRGGELAKNARSTVARVYSWPSNRPPVREAVELDVEVLQEYVGTYRVKNVDMKITMRDGALFMSVANKRTSRLFAAERDLLFLLTSDVELRFERDTDGAISGLIVKTTKETMKGRKTR